MRPLVTELPGASTATLAQVALAAGVGESTVSRVLRNHGSFSLRSRERVLAAVERLGYVPNRIAGTLASNGSPLVAVVIPSLSNIVFNDVLRGVSSALERTRHQAVFAVSEYDADREATLVAAMLAWRPRALMLAGLEHSDATIKMLAAADCRVVELLDIDGTPLDLAVGFSNSQAGRVSARYLLDRGYRRIGYVGHNIERDRRAAKRFAGFSAILAAAGYPLAGAIIDAGPSSIAAGRAGLAQLRAAYPQIDAVYFSNDDMAIGGYFECLAAGIAVPHGLALFGYNGLDIAAATPQPLTTIRTPRARIGETAADLVTADAPAQVIDLGFEIITGATA